MWLKTDLPPMKDSDVMNYVGNINNEPYERIDLYSFRNKLYRWTSKDLQTPFWEVQTT